MMNRLAFAAVALWATFARAEPPPSPPPLEAYGKLPAIEDARLSPDGKRLALIATDGDNRFIAVTDLATNQVLVRVPAGRKKLLYVEWAGANHIVTGVEVDSDASGLVRGTVPWILATDIDLVKLRAHPLIDSGDSYRNGESMNAISGNPQIRTVDGQPVLFVQGWSFGPDGAGYPALFRYDPTLGLSQRLVMGTGGWLMDQDGMLLAQEQYDETAKRWSLRTRVAGGMTTALALTVGLEMPFVEGLGRTGDTVLLSVMSDDKGGERRRQLVEVGPGQASWGPPLFDEPDQLVLDPVSQRPIGAGSWGDGDTWSYTFLDPADQNRWKALLKAYPGSSIRLRSMSGDHQRWMLSVDSSSEGQAYALVDFASGKAQWMGNDYEAPSRFMSEKKPIAFKATDGMALSGYITLPKGRDPRNLPLVVFPHGGPQARDEPGFDWWAQAMASRGYAVLQVNFRGSDGFGWKHLSAGFGQWGRKMQTDLSDGVRYLAAQGTIDPKRVCIVGASYGGYAALAGPTLDPGVYRCAVSVAGISDLRRIVRWSGKGPARRYDLRFMGVDKLGDPKLDEISPLRHIDKVDAPILLIHGKDDAVVDFSQSELMYEALKKAGKDAQLVVLNHEDHWLLTGATRLQMLQATMDFLQKNNPPG